MDLNDFNQSKYLSGREVPEAGIDLTIAGFEVVKMNDGTSKPAVSWVQAFKPMLLNKTNRRRLELIFLTSATEGMVNRQIGVFFDRMVQGPNGDMCGGLRLRPASTPQPGHMPNPARPYIAPPGHVPQIGVAAQPSATAQAFRDAPPPPVENVHETGDWTQEVPF